MKKLLLIMTMLFTLLCSSVAMAADGGDLNKEQKIAEQMINAVKQNSTITYEQISGSLSADLAKTFNARSYAGVQKSVKEQLGDFKESKFVSFTRFDQADRVVYLTSFSNQPVVIAQFDFDKSGKLLNFAFAPQQQQQEAAK